MSDAAKAAALVVATSELAAAEVDAAQLPRQWPIEITLKYPVKFGSEVITALSFRRGRAGDMKGIKLRDDLPADDVLLIASRLCGQPTKALEMLDIDDAGEVVDIAMDFFTKYLAAGKRR